MTKLGTKAHPIVVRVKTEERGQYIAQECQLRGWHFIVGFEPDKPEDISDFEKACNPPTPIQSEKFGRNDPCPCGSGKKYKKCCDDAGAQQFGGNVPRYDPEIPPDPIEWLALDEGKRLLIIEGFHHAARVEIPSAKAHAVMHLIVESQIAGGLESTTRAMRRLRAEGLSRHDALHAIGTVVSEHIFEAINANEPESAKSADIIYNAAVERLTAKEWRQRYGS